MGVADGIILNESTYPATRAIGVSQLEKMSFHEIFHLTAAGVYLYFSTTCNTTAPVSSRPGNNHSELDTAHFRGMRDPYIKLILPHQHLHRAHPLSAPMPRLVQRDELCGHKLQDKFTRHPSTSSTTMVRADASSCIETIYVVTHCKTKIHSANTASKATVTWPFSE